MSGRDNPDPPIVVNVFGDSQVEWLQAIDDVVANVSGGSFDRVTVLGDSVYVVYNKWWGQPGSPHSVNYGTYIGRVQLMF